MKSHFQTGAWILCAFVVICIVTSPSSTTRQANNSDVVKDNVKNNTSTNTSSSSSSNNNNTRSNNKPTQRQSGDLSFSTLTAPKALRSSSLTTQYSSSSSSLTAQERSSSSSSSVEQQCAPKYPRCDLQNTTVGIPTVLISLGRSGSSAIWDIMSGLVSPSVRIVREDVGHGPYPIQQFMKKQQQQHQQHEGSESGHCWLVNILCKYHTKLLASSSLDNNNDKDENDDAVVVFPPLYGTKWKPFQPSFNMRAARAALAWLATAPHVKVVYSERNPLDVHFSKVKHHSQKATPAHCSASDSECIAKHQQVAQGTEIPIATLLSDLECIVSDNRKARDSLQTWQVPHVSIQYEKLFYDPTANEWEKTVDFLLSLTVDKKNNQNKNAVQQRPEQQEQQRRRRFPHITRSTVQSVMQFASTNSGNRNSTVANYEEVVQTLRGSQFEGLLSY